jgi:hypothetical protein
MLEKLLPAALIVLTAWPVSIALGATDVLGGLPADPEAMESRFSERPYSPWAETRFPQRVYWGDTHLHTGLSVDAGLFGARLGLEDAYRFARGEQVTSSTGQPARLSRPLDWLVIADHSDGMGMVDDLAAAAPSITRFEQGARWSEGLRAGGQKAVETALDLITTFSQGDVDPELIAAYSPGSKIYASVWEKVVNTADEYDDPGSFTTLIGFEWTSLVDGNNLHRNVIYRDGAGRAGRVMPYTTLEPIGSTDPLKLYEWMESYEATTGGSVLALAHNGNLSNGLMFPVDAQYTGRKLDQLYVQQRARWEPMYEVTQIKGDGEAHPLLSPDDAFADYETWDAGNLDLSEAKQPEMLQGEYAREALKNGLLLEARLGTNPYKFGLVGSTDSHTALATAEEDNFFGKHSGSEPSPDRMTHPFTETEQGRFEGWEQVASGLAAVWYEKGVPMGSDLPARPADGAPTFMVYAIRDPIGANLDRIQVVKGWVDGQGRTHEKVYDVAWSDDRAANPDGTVPAVGNTVDVENANWTNTVGAAELGTVWTDPDFEPAEPAFYYARVIEIPTPRWIAYDAARYGTEIPDGAETVHQERAYTSPIWYTPRSPATPSSPADSPSAGPHSEDATAPDA